MAKLYVAADTAFFAPNGHLQIVYEDDSGKRLETEVQSPNFTTLGNWKFMPFGQPHNKPDDEDYGFYELNLEPEQSESHVWALLEQIHESLKTEGADLDYIALTQNSNSYIRTLLGVIGNDIDWSKEFVSDGMTSFPGWGRDVYREAELGWTTINGLPLNVAGTAGNDIINGGNNNDNIHGSGGEDTISGGDGNDDLRGEGGDDEIYGGEGRDTLYGGTGNDILHAEVQDELVNGEGGTADTAVFRLNWREYTLSRNSTSDFELSANGETVSIYNVERLEFANGESFSSINSFFDAYDEYQNPTPPPSPDPDTLPDNSPSGGDALPPEPTPDPEPVPNSPVSDFVPSGGSSSLLLAGTRNDAEIKTGTSIPVTDLYPESGWIDALGADDITYFAISDRTDGGGYLTYRGSRVPDADFHEMSVNKLDDWEFVAGEPGAEDTIGFNIIQADGTFSERIPDSLAATVTATAADLVVEDVEVRGDRYDRFDRVDHVFAPGDRFTVEFDVANDGNADAASTEAGLYFHDGDDWSIPAVDTEDVKSIDVGRSDSGEELSFEIPEYLEDGVYLLAIYADHELDEPEWPDNQNNVFALQIAVAESPAPPPEPEIANLDVGSLSLGTTTWTEGKTVSVEWRVENDGDATASSSQSGVFLSTNDRITTSDLRIGSLQATGTLSPNESVNQSTSISVDLDALGVAPGEYYIGVIADVQNQIVESSEGNNSSHAARIDLVGLNAPPSLAVQQDGSFPEKTENAVATVTTSDPDGDTLELALSGADAALFEIVGEEIFFLDPPDFEVPRDADGDNVYSFTVTSSDGEATATEAVDVTVEGSKPPHQESEEVSLVLDQIVTNELGNGFNGQSAPNGKVVASFQNTGTDLALRFKGYDVDRDDEIEVLLNGNSLGYLEKGVNDGLSDHTLLLDAADQVEGENRLVFSQAVDPNWKWGVTDLLLKEPLKTSVDMSYPLANLNGIDVSVRSWKPNEPQEGGGKINPGGWGGSAHALVYFDAPVIRSGASLEQLDLILTMDDPGSWNRDGSLVVGQMTGVWENSVTYNSKPDHTNEFPISNVQSGELSIDLTEFAENWANGTDPNFGIGIRATSTDKEDNSFASIENPDASIRPKISYTYKVQESNFDTVLALDSVETDKFGNKYGGKRADDGFVVASFMSDGSPMTLSFSGYDIDSASEVEILLNGKSLAYVEQGQNNGLSQHEVLLPADHVRDGENALVFAQRISPYFKWGVTDLELSLPDADLEVGTADTGRYGNGYDGQSAPDGQVQASFTGTDSDLILDFQGYDIDHGGEVELFLNGASQGFLTQGPNNGLQRQQFVLEAGDQEAGANLLAFEQRDNPAFKWGVGDLRLVEASGMDQSLALDRQETSAFGNGFNGASNATGAIAFGFAGTGQNLIVDFQGYDIDANDEVEVFLNDVSQGFLTQGPNNSLQAQSFALAAADQVEGLNELRFEQQDNPAYKWGITDLMLATLPGEFLLRAGVTESGSFGNGFNGATDADGSIMGTFLGTGEDLLLRFDGYDIDSNAEVELFLNDVSQGFLAAGPNNGLQAQAFGIAASDQVAGVNELRFEQQDNPAFKWGFTDLLLDAPPGDFALTVGETDATSYGNGFNGATDADGRITAGFIGRDSDLILDFEGYDIDHGGEVEVLLNGASQGFLTPGPNNGEQRQQFVIEAGDQQEGANLLAFEQRDNPAFKWGFTEVTLVGADTVDQALALDRTETSPYGNGFNGAADADGSITFGFAGTDEDLDFTFQGFDIDHGGEVELFLNDVSQGFLAAGPNNGLQAQAFAIAAADQVDGLNELRFEQQDNPAFKWGVTDLLLEIA